MVNVMDDMADSLNNAYQEFVAAAANVIETKELESAQKTVGTDTLLENFKHKWEFFRVACDQAEEIVESAKQRIESECLVDEATGTGTATVNPKPGQTATPSLTPMNAVRLEQMSKAVRRLMIELQHGSGAASVHQGIHILSLFLMPRLTTVDDICALVELQKEMHNVNRAS